ncbi:unnamed protein product [Dovyalis caffra]|uniref:Uncharacterized protein n=1 Tax=Dovyalis caffra TaxID=77055 RepID=A0AAV1S683_9ROSI|nr:unnamed protein product [Dovyalis caffra]
MGFSTASLSVTSLSSFCVVFSLYLPSGTQYLLRKIVSSQQSSTLVTQIRILVDSLLPSLLLILLMEKLTFTCRRGAKSLNLSYLSAYLDSLGANFTVGANFATAASTIRLPTSIVPNGGFSPFYLAVQYAQFIRFNATSQLIRKQGGVFAQLMPKDEYFQKALYTFDIGQNDLGAGFFGNMSVEEVNASVPSIVDAFSTNVTKDSIGCAKPYNEVAQYFNYKLKEAVVQLRKDFPSAAFTYVDVYSVKYSLFREPKKHGFDELPLVVCCGYGGMYNYSASAGCGATTTVNGTQITVGSCDDPSARVVWDGIHYTEAANKFVFEQTSTGAFSDPPTTLNMACQPRGNIG